MNRIPSAPRAVALSAANILLALTCSRLAAQEQPASPVALPERVAPAPAATTMTRTETEILTVDPKVPAPAPAPSQPAPTPLKAGVTPTKGGILLNFQGASLNDVLNYLSEAAGFVIVQEARVEGTVNVVSRQAVSADEAVDLLNAVLLEKGYTAVRTGRILKIVSRKDAQKRDLPVMVGSDPTMIPSNDGMVTQILPLRYGEASKLVENLRPLLAENTTMSSNEGANSIILTDTQTNVRRIAKIITAIDTAVEGIPVIRVYPLQFANAKDLATVITQLFSNNPSGGGGGRGGRGGGGGGGFAAFFGGGGQGGGGQGGGGQPAGQSEARQAAQRVVAVADDQSNSLIVSAPDNLIPTITEMIEKIDTTITDVTTTKVFNLKKADAVETADLITNLYADTTTNANRGRNGNNQGGDRGGQGGGGQGAQGGQASQQSQRALLQTRVVAIGDPRTNSVLVSAARDTMAEIAEMIGRLDASDAKRQRVFVHSLEHADADAVANVLRGMLGDTSFSGGAQQTGANRLQERSSTGAAIDATGANTGGGGGTGGRAGRGGR